MTGSRDDLIRWLLNQDKETLFDISKHREKRSLTANAYMWVLIGKIADVVRASKDEVYLEMLKRYSQREMVRIRSDVNLSGYIKYYEAVGSGYIEGIAYTDYYIYKGSSDFDSREMSVMIDGVVADAKDLGIETLPPQEIARLKSLERLT